MHWIETPENIVRFYVKEPYSPLAQRQRRPAQNRQSLSSNLRGATKRIKR